MRHAVRISDGLGNQMFQYAFAYALSKRTGDEVRIDPFFFKNGLRHYQLDNFNIKLDRLVSREMDYILGFGPRDGGRFKKAYREHLIKKNYLYVEEQNKMHFDSVMLFPQHDSFFMGFWQAPGYFDQYYESIKEQFQRVTPLSDKAKEYLEMVNDCASVSLHIRRTDYIGDDFDSSLDVGFYKTALEELREKLGDFKLFVFSDDKGFITSNFNLMPYTMVEGLSDIDEFEIMRNCKNHVIANSTFSWWATYLGDNKGGIVYAPRVASWKDEYYPSVWNQISTNLIKSRV